LDGEYNPEFIIGLWQIHGHQNGDKMDISELRWDNAK